MLFKYFYKIYYEINATNTENNINKNKNMFSES